MDEARPLSMHHPLLVRSVLAAVATCGLAVAQGTFDLDRSSRIAITQPLDLRWDNLPAPGFMLTAISTVAGPTGLPPEWSSRPLDIVFDPTFPLIFTPAGGVGGVINIGTLPNDPYFVQQVLQFQSVILQSGTPLLRDISNRVAGQIGDATGNTTLTSLMTQGAANPAKIRRPASATNNTQYLIAGGATTLPTTPLAATKRFDVRTLTWTPGPNLNEARFLAETVELLDGRTMVIGGIGADPISGQSSSLGLASCEIYDPVTDQFTFAAPMQQARCLHAAALMSDGRVLVVGGTSSLLTTTGALTGTTNVSEIYDPATNTWINGPAVHSALVAPALTPLANGDLLLSGGLRASTSFLAVTTMTTCNLFAVNAANPNGVWTPAASMIRPRAWHQSQAVRLFDGRVLAVGGCQLNIIAGQINTIGYWEVFTPSATPGGPGSWTTQPVPNDVVPTPVGGAGTISGGTFFTAGNTIDVILAGGVSGTGQVTDVFLPPTREVRKFDPVSMTWTLRPLLNQPRSVHVAFVTLPDQLMCLAGGLSTSLVPLPTLEILQ